LNPEYAKYKGKPLDNGKGKRYNKMAQKYGEYIRKEDEEILVTLVNTINGGISLVRGRSYAVKQSVDLYPTSATSDDYAFSRRIVDPDSSKIYGFTIDFGKREEGFIPNI
jgi:carboxypeptidase T